MLKTDHICELKLCKKLSEKCIGPLKIINKIESQTYQLYLKKLVGKIYDTFNFEQFEIFNRLQKGQSDYGMEWIVSEEKDLKSFKNDIKS